MRPHIVCSSFVWSSFVCVCFAEVNSFVGYLVYSLLYFCPHICLWMFQIKLLERSIFFCVCLCIFLSFRMSMLQRLRDRKVQMKHVELHVAEVTSASSATASAASRSDLQCVFFVPMPPPIQAATRRQSHLLREFDVQNMSSAFWMCNKLAMKLPILVLLMRERV